MKQWKVETIYLSKDGTDHAHDRELEEYLNKLQQQGRYIKSVDRIDYRVYQIIYTIEEE